MIVQPSYLPWRGFFDLMHRADVFVHYDDVQYTRSDWRSRNRIRVPGGTAWLTIPVENAGFVQSAMTIDQARVHWRRDWTRSHLGQLRASYRRAPYFEDYFPIVAEALAVRHERLVDYTIPLTERLARALGIVTRTARASELRIGGDDPTARLVAICRHLGADRYLSGPAAREYLDESQFERAGIAVEWMSYDYPPYRQIDDVFEPAVSVLDLLFMEGPRAPDLIWAGSTPRHDVV